MIRRPPRSTLSSSSAASDVYKRQIRNHDVNGSIHFNKLYNPFRRSYYNITLERNFAYIFQGDAWINMLKRNNIYLNNGIGIGHSFEVVNGLYLFTDFNMALRRSV